MHLSNCVPTSQRVIPDWNRQPNTIHERLALSRCWTLQQCVPALENADLIVTINSALRNNRARNHDRCYGLFPADGRSPQDRMFARAFSSSHDADQNRNCSNMPNARPGLRPARFGYGTDGVFSRLHSRKPAIGAGTHDAPCRPIDPLWRIPKKSRPVDGAASVLVPEAGIEPARLAARDFLPTSTFAASAPALFVGWSTPSPSPCGLRCPPSALYTFPWTLRSGLGSALARALARPGRSPTLTGSPQEFPPEGSNCFKSLVSTSFTTRAGSGPRPDPHSHGYRGFGRTVHAFGCMRPDLILTQGTAQRCRHRDGMHRQASASGRKPCVSSIADQKATRHDTERFAWRSQVANGTGGTRLQAFSRLRR